VTKADEKRNAILAALKTKSPQTPGELAKVLKLKLPTLAYQMKPLLKRRAVIASGSTASRQFSLPGRAKEAP
jgi:DNA-binding transcriptional ArsR family regulator